MGKRNIYTEEEAKIKFYESVKRYKEKHKDEIKEYNKKYHREYRKTHKLVKTVKYTKIKTTKTKEEKTIYQRDYRRKRRAEDLEFRIKDILRSRISSAIKNKANKGKRTLELVGCSMPEFIKYLESKFTEGMSWENYGYYGWHIDHIRPCASFNLLNEDEQKKCFHYTNLQPLWAIDNRKKWSKY